MANGISTLDDVARLAGVSKSTASRILAVKKGQNIPFAGDTQERVRQAASLLGYRPSKLARGLTKARTGIVGLVMPSIKDSYFPSVTSIIEAKLAEEGISVILCNTNGNSGIERAKIEDLLSWHVDGFVIAPSQETGDSGIFWELWRRKTPFVLIDRTFSQSPFYSVTTDDYSGASMAIEHLLSIGRTRIAEARSTFLISTVATRHGGYTDTLMKHGIIPDPSYSIEVPPSEEGGHMVIDQMMKLDPKPDAVFCLSDIVAIGALEECLKRGIRVPEDIAICGFADLKHSDMLRVPLTTIRQPQALLGETAAQMLLDQMNGKTPEVAQVKLPVELMVRDSTVPSTK